MIIEIFTYNIIVGSTIFVVGPLQCISSLYAQISARNTVYKNLPYFLGVAMCLSLVSSCFAICRYYFEACYSIKTQNLENSKKSTAGLALNVILMPAIIIGIPAVITVLWWFVSACSNSITQPNVITYLYSLSTIQKVDYVFGILCLIYGLYKYFYTEYCATVAFINATTSNSETLITISN